MSVTGRLRALLAEGLVIAPTIYDALSARLVQQAGLPACFMSGFGIAATRYGLPDTGLIAASEMTETLRLICAANPGFPVLADGDTGYGNAMNVRRTVVEYARAGAAAVMIEDQEFPKRCGHMSGKRVVSRAEAAMRIRAAAEARAEAGQDILIIARTDARAPEGYDAARERLLAYAAEGADILFFEAAESEAEMREFCAISPRPTMVNMVPGGKTPILSPAALGEMGAGVALYNPTLFAAIPAMQSALAALRDGDPLGPPRLAPFAEVSALTGAPEYQRLADRYAIIK
jgi:2-methylisocitrate lyase-like PEP mutase family enzyme